MGKMARRHSGFRTDESTNRLTAIGPNKPMWRSIPDTSHKVSGVYSNNVHRQE